MIASIPIPAGLDSFGPYQVLEELGAVPYGTLYRVLDTRSDEPAMLKVIPPSLQGGWQGSAPWEILLQETYALARIYHRGLPTLLEIAEHEGSLLVAFAPVEGESLRDWLEQGGRPDRELLAEWGGEILEALQEAHAAGICHRHLGEDEVFLTSEGHLILTGFGLTQLSFDSVVPLPPEQLAGEPFTPQSDLYAVGSLLHRLAFVSGLRGHHGAEAGRDPLLKVVARSTFADRSARFESAADMAEALRQAGRAHFDPRPREAGEPRTPAPCVPLFRHTPVHTEEPEDGDRRHALLLLASSILLMICLILAGWLILEKSPGTGGPESTPGTDTASASVPVSALTASTPD